MIARCRYRRPVGALVAYIRDGRETAVRIENPLWRIKYGRFSNSGAPRGFYDLVAGMPARLEAPR